MLKGRTYSSLSWTQLAPDEVVSLTFLIVSDEEIESDTFSAATFADEAASPIFSIAPWIELSSLTTELLDKSKTKTSIKTIAFFVAIFSPTRIY
ncbi:hypothetical protein PanWU01x14_293980 [Parasponia andersonii]|uniref:Uncharacterized protein n=1 Tax=Parasponia andersonii TaxID=3476 RepID=A0A2P5AWF0_PARAD|nr:hypothetical protein PanWU01x14_293980 [Parasponia andersonii]